MDKALKQRLLGAVVLIVLAVAFLPMLFDGSGRKDQKTPEGSSESVFTVTPEAPQPDRVAQAKTQAAPDETGISTSVTPGPAAPMPATAAPITPAPSTKAPITQAPENSVAWPLTSEVESAPADLPEKPTAEPGLADVQRVPPAKPKTSPAPQAGWVVQVGSFRNPDNAQALRKRLRAAGYPVLEAPATGGLYRVQVGPEPKRDHAEALRVKLQAKENIRGVVLDYP